MLNSVQIYINGLLDGLALPYGDKLTSYVQPPIIEPLEGPRCYVWGGTAHETRQSAPRGPGFKRIAWLIDVFLTYESMQDELDGGNFPQIVDAAMQALRSTPIPVKVTDTATGTVTQLVEIGETITLDYPPLHTAQSERTLYWAAKLTCSVLEVIQA